MKKSAENNLF